MAEGQELAWESQPIAYFNGVNGSTLTLGKEPRRSQGDQVLYFLDRMANGMDHIVTEIQRHNHCVASNESGIIFP